MNNVVEVKNLGKKYSIGNREKYLTLRDLFVKAAKVPGNLMQGKKFRKKQEFWALRDLNFTVEKGEVIGIIGRNGAGKSTLLKILSRITEPTEGEVRLNGRVSSLLEVGTGFHPELTGRENIYLNGAIMGMKKKEIEKKFGEIVEFSGVEKFLDMPVKRYSSGMQVRLAFSVAAHLEPDILIIDEVLAVGDAEFQKKCLGKMDEVTKEAGRTILFVSHDMGAIQKLCKRTILLDNGEIVMIGDTQDVLKKYLSFGKSLLSSTIKEVDSRPGNKKWIFEKLELFDGENNVVSSFNEEDEIVIQGAIVNRLNDESAVISAVLCRDDGVIISKSFSKTINRQDCNFELRIKGSNLYSGTYNLNFWLGSIDGKDVYDYVEPGLQFEFVNKKQRPGGINYSDGVILLDSTWDYESRK
ncbi:MAG: polysaccharide ABC transporter ATP-binding protein [Candidatus Dojkabacteria bacterium]